MRCACFGARRAVAKWSRLAMGRHSVTERDGNARGPKVFWLALLAVWPLVYMCSVAAMMFISRHRHDLPLWIARYWFWLLPIGLVLGIAAFAIDAARNPRLPTVDRVGWIVAIILASFPTLPVYWWLHVFKRRKLA